MAALTADELDVEESPDQLSLRYYDVVSADGTRLRAWTNDAEGPTVLLCNGLGTNPFAWPALLRRDAGVRVISWNHRGVAGSDRPADRSRVGVDAFVEDALAVLDDAGVEAAPVMGWSIGVNTMFELAVRHPERVLGLFAVAGVPGDTFASMGAPIFLPKPLRKPLTVNLARVVKAFGKPISLVSTNLPVTGRTIDVLSHSGFMFPVADKELSRQAIETFLSTPVDWYFHLGLHASAHLRVSLRNITVPTAFLAGKYDLLADHSDMKSAAARIPEATYAELRGTHFITMEHPDVVHAHLLDFLERI